jgi:hypothetical protein
MFHQLNIDSRDRDLLRFLWFDARGNIVDYRMTVHIFGATSSPGCANFGLKKAAKDLRSEYPEAAHFVQNKFYVNDGLVSLPTQEEAIRLTKDTIALCSKRGMQLHKFVSNDLAVVHALVPQHAASQDNSDVSLPTSKISANKTLGGYKALGIHWDTFRDCLTFNPTAHKVPKTRREALSLLASLYDPLGLAAPFIMKGKLSLQEMCRYRNSWDTPMAAGMSDKWKSWLEDLMTISDLKIPRYYKFGLEGKLSAVELHTFCDASSIGYGACAYLRFQHVEFSSSALVMSKSRVAPLKPITVPRLELEGAVVGVKLANLLLRELHLDDMKTFFWTDSQAVLSYINNDSRRFHTYVCNRVDKIRTLSAPSTWGYVPSRLNPADLISRGSPVVGLLDCLWLQEPDVSTFGQLQLSSLVLDSLDPEVRHADMRSCFCSVDTSIIDRLSKRHVQSLAEQFWSRWRHEYLSTLQKRQKWNTFQRTVKIGDVVLIVDENTVRSSWRLGLIVGVDPSQDGAVRKVSVRVVDRCLDSRGRRCSTLRVLERPVHKCILLVD